MSTIKVNALRHTGGSSDNINLDSSARVLIGPSSWTGTHKLSVQANSSSSTGSGNVALIRGEGAADMSAGDVLGRIEFLDEDGGRYAFIDGRTDAASGSSDHPGRLTFQTTADGASSPTEAMRIDSSQNLLFNSGYGSVATAYGVRAWVNFNGRNTLSIYDDGGITSITDNGTGDYTVNFDFTMPDINYAFTGSASYAAAQSSAVHTVELRGNTARSTSKTTTSIRHDVVYSDGSQNRTRFDYDEISIVYFR